MISTINIASLFSNPYDAKKMALVLNIYNAFTCMKQEKSRFNVTKIILSLKFKVNK